MHTIIHAQRNDTFSKKPSNSHYIYLNIRLVFEYLCNRVNIQMNPAFVSALATIHYVVYRLPRYAMLPSYARLQVMLGGPRKRIWAI